MPHTVPLAEYLFTRLHQLGVRSIHGVPGDYNLALLDYIAPGGLHWVGNCNELNAGYATDGYSRVKGLGALITTFGVGELSASNAIAGAYAELAPVVHIVGTPARQLQESRALIHHTFNDGEYGRFAQMAKQVTVAQANLLDPRTCPQLIDDTIQQCLVHSRPVYIQLPSDMVAVPVAADRLGQKIELPVAVSPKDEQAAIALVLDRIYSCQRPMILVDGETRAYNMLDELHELITSTQWPTWVSIFGKSNVDESLPNFQGIWRGNFATAEEQQYVGACDLILCFGPHFSNTNTYTYTSIPSPDTTIFFTQTTIKAAGQSFRDLPAKYCLSKVLKEFDPAKARKSTTFTQAAPAPIGAPSSNGRLTQDIFYKLFNRFLRPGDVVLGETGTAGHGCRDFKLPPSTILFKPSTWLSIGYMLPASQGAALAQRELHAAGNWHHSAQGFPPRTVLLIGDGSFQMTAQELSIIIREKLNVLLLLINNDGYTIERCLHGWNQSYNDIAFWRYLQAPSLFGATSEKDHGYHAITARVETWGELEKVFEEESDKDGPVLKMVEVIMGKEDAPITLATLLQKLKEKDNVKVNGEVVDA